MRRYSTIELSRPRDSTVVSILVSFTTANVSFSWWQDATVTHQERGYALFLHISVVFGFRVSVDEKGYPYFQYRVSPLTAITEEMLWGNVAPHSNARIQMEKFSQHERSARIGTEQSPTRVTLSHCKQKHQT